MSVIGTLLSTFFSSIGTYDILIFFITFFILRVLYFYFTYFTRDNPLPGPFPLPFVGNVLDHGFEDFVGYTERMRKKYGEMFEIYIGPQKFIMLSKYEYMQNMFDFSLNSKYLRRISHLPGLKELNISGKGIALNHEVGVWKYNRYFLSRALLTPSFAPYAVIWSQNIVEDMMGFWKDMFNEKGYFETNIVDWAHRFTFDSITHFSTGKRIHAVEAFYTDLLASRGEEPKRPSNNDIQNASSFFMNIKTFFSSIYYFIVVPSWVRNHFPFFSSMTKSYLKNRDWVYENIDQLIRTRRKEIDHTPPGQALRGDILTSMITVNTDRDATEVKYDHEHMLTRPMTDEEIRAVLWEVFVGGIDTTANSFTFIIYYFSKHPEVLRRLRVELDAFFDKRGNRPLDLDSLSELVYTEAVIREILRIHTPAPYTARNSTKEDVVGGYFWPKETQYIINIHGMNHNKRYWDEPEKFNPDRWLDSTKNLKLMPHIEFGGGRRVCPGRKLAYIALKVLIATIFHKLDIELVDKNTPLKTNFIFVRSFPKLDVHIKQRIV